MGNTRFNSWGSKPKGEEEQRIELGSTHLGFRPREGDLWRAGDVLDGGDGSLLLLLLMLHVLGFGRNEAVEARFLRLGFERGEMEIDKRMRDFFFFFQIFRERDGG